MILFLPSNSRFKLKISPLFSELILKINYLSWSDPRAYAAIDLDV